MFQKIILSKKISLFNVLINSIVLGAFTWSYINMPAKAEIHCLQLPLECIKDADNSNKAQRKIDEIDQTVRDKKGEWIEKDIKKYIEAKLTKILILKKTQKNLSYIKRIPYRQVEFLTIDEIKSELLSETSETEYSQYFKFINNNFYDLTVDNLIVTRNNIYANLIFIKVRRLLDYNQDELAKDELIALVSENGSVEIEEDLKFLLKKGNLHNPFKSIINKSLYKTQYEVTTDFLSHLALILTEFLVIIGILRIIIFIARPILRLIHLEVIYFSLRQFFIKIFYFCIGGRTHIFKFPIVFRDFDIGAIDNLEKSLFFEKLKNILRNHRRIGEDFNINFTYEAISEYKSPISFPSPIKLPIPAISLIYLLFPKVTFEIDGYLILNNMHKGIGISIHIKNYFDEEKTEIFWKNDYDPYDQIENHEISSIVNLLLEPIAIWILFEVNPDAFKTWMGGCNWKYYSYCYAALHCKNNNFIKSAKLLFTKSIPDKSAQNLLSREAYSTHNSRISSFNRGIIALESYCNSKQEKAKDSLLISARKDLEYASRASEYYSQYNLNKKEFIYDSIWYKSKYNLAFIDLFEFVNRVDSSKDISNHIKELLFSFIDIEILNLQEPRFLNKEKEKYWKEFIFLNDKLFKFSLLLYLSYNPSIDSEGDITFDYNKLTNEYFIFKSNKASINKHFTVIKFELFENIFNLNKQIYHIIRKIKFRKSKDIERSNIEEILMQKFNLALGYTNNAKTAVENEEHYNKENSDIIYNRACLYAHCTRLIIEMINDGTLQKPILSQEKINELQKERKLTQKYFLENMTIACRLDASNIQWTEINPELNPIKKHHILALQVRNMLFNLKNQ